MRCPKTIKPNAAAPSSSSRTHYGSTIPRVCSQPFVTSPSKRTNSCYQLNSSYPQAQTGSGQGTLGKKCSKNLYCSTEYSQTDWILKQLEVHSLPAQTELTNGRAPSLQSTNFLSTIEEWTKKKHRGNNYFHTYVYKKKEGRAKYFVATERTLFTTEQD